MSLADELLADLEDGEEEEMATTTDEPEGLEEIAEVEEEEAMEQDWSRVGSLAKLRDSARFRKLLSDIAGVAEEREVVRGPVEADPEYPIIVQANNISAEIEGEIATIHKFTRDKYNKRFPELESLVPNPLEYMALAAGMGNDVLEKAADKDFLSAIIAPATVIVVSVTGSTTQGAELSKEELEAVEEACQMAKDLQEARVKIFQFVEQRMGFIAPNLAACVGATVAAKLMGTAGGLTELSKMPACNILVLGAQRRTLSGFSSTAVLPHAGFIYFSPMVQGLPPDLRSKGARVISAKCTLAARVDAVHSSPDGAAGRGLLEEMQRKIEKLLEPPPVKKVKALPKPLDQSSKKRGGKRVRKMKERLGLTEMRKKANRMNFAHLEEDILQTDVGFTLGQMKKGGTGARVRGPVVDQKSRVRMSKMLAKSVGRANLAGGGATVVRGMGLGGSAGGSTSVRSKQVAGTASSISFTPVQGLEIVNPQANESKVAEANAKYFASTATFLKVQTPLPGSSRDTS